MPDASLAQTTANAYAAPLRLNGGAVSDPENVSEADDVHMTEDEGVLTDSTEEDTSMQIASSSRQASLAPELQKTMSSSSGSQAASAASVAGVNNVASPARTAVASPRDIPPYKPASQATASPAKLYVCEGCFKYTQYASSYALHIVRMTGLQSFT